MKIKVELYSSHNNYIDYPANGLIDVLEVGVNGEVISAVFIEISDIGKKSPPVLIKNPTFKYFG